MACRAPASAPAASAPPAVPNSTCQAQPARNSGISPSGFDITGKTDLAEPAAKNPIQPLEPHQHQNAGCDGGANRCVLGSGNSAFSVAEKNELGVSSSPATPAATRRPEETRQNQASGHDGQGRRVLERGNSPSTALDKNDLGAPSTSTTRAGTQQQPQQRDVRNPDGPGRRILGRGISAFTALDKIVLGVPAPTPTPSCRVLERGNSTLAVLDKIELGAPFSLALPRRYDRQHQQQLSAQCAGCHGGASHPVLETGPSGDSAAFLTALDKIELGGCIRIGESLRLALMALKSRPVRSARARVVLFIGSPPADPFPAPGLRQAAAALRRAAAAVDVLCFGEAATAPEWAKTLDEFVHTARRDSGSHFLRVPPYGASGGVDSLAFHLLKTLVRDRETARVMWRHAFSSDSSLSPPPSPPPQDPAPRVRPVHGGDSFLVDRNGTPLLRLPPPSESCRQAAAVAEAFQSLHNVDRESQLPPPSFSLTLALSRVSCGEGNRAPGKDQQQQQQGAPRPKLLLLLPVQQMTKEILAEIPAGRIVVSPAGLATPQRRKGSLAFNRLSPAILQFVWRDRTTGNAEYEAIVLRGEGKVTLRRRDDGRIIVIDVVRPSHRKKILFWLQSTDASKDEALVELMNQHMDAQSFVPPLPQLAPLLLPTSPSTSPIQSIRAPVALRFPVATTSSSGQPPSQPPQQQPPPPPAPRRLREPSPSITPFELGRAMADEPELKTARPQLVTSSCSSVATMVDKPQPLTAERKSLSSRHVSTPEPSSPPPSPKLRPLPSPAESPVLPGSPPSPRLQFLQLKQPAVAMAPSKEKPLSPSEAQTKQEQKKKNTSDLLRYDDPCKPRGPAATQTTRLPVAQPKFPSPPLKALLARAAAATMPDMAEPGSSTAPKTTAQAKSSATATAIPTSKSPTTEDMKKKGSVPNSS